MFQNSVNIAGKRQGTFATGSQSELLVAGVYDVWADNNVYIKVDPTLASNVTSGTGYLIQAGNIVPVRLTAPAYIGGAGIGNVYYHRVD